MLLSQLDVRHAHALNASALAVMLTFATIVKPNGIQIKHVMQHVLRDKAQCEHHLEALAKIHNIVQMTSNHARDAKCLL